jgi:hypothetical protein
MFHDLPSRKADDMTHIPVWVQLPEKQQYQCCKPKGKDRIPISQLNQLDREQIPPSPPTPFCFL